MINVIGLGYIGLPTALILAANGGKITGTDINKDTISKLNKNEVPFEEEGLESLFQLAIENGIHFQTTYTKAKYYIITVPTPYVEETKKIDTTYLCTAVESVLKKSLPGAYIIIESTISPGTIDTVVRPLIESKGFIIGKDVHLVHAPERILPGKMIEELKNNARTIGADTREIAQEIKEIYKSFCDGEIICTDIKTAEMTKVVENTYRAVNIAFANELAQLCDEGGMNVYDIVEIANKHPRVNILSPGPGVGGHCIPVDPWFLVGDYPQHTGLIHKALMINANMPAYILNKSATLARESGVSPSEIGVYGITYKKDVDDIRESPTLQLFDYLDTNFGYTFPVYDPLVTKKVLPSQCMDFEEFLNKIKLIIIMVDHQHVINHKDLIQEKVILDTKNCLEKGDLLFSKKK